MTRTAAQVFEYMVDSGLYDPWSRRDNRHMCNALVSAHALSLITKEERAQCRDAIAKYLTEVSRLHPLDARHLTMRGAFARRGLPMQATGLRYLYTHWDERARFDQRNIEITQFITTKE